MAYLLKNAKIYDGTGADPFIGDIIVRGDRIEKIGEGLTCDGAQMIDLHGLSVSSGFMDAHSHNDWFAIRCDPRPFFEPFIRQGITSFITGNCGLSATGFAPDTPYLDKIGGGLFGYRGEETGVYPSAGALLDAADGRSPCNIAVLVGHCSARAGITVVMPTWYQALSAEEKRRPVNKRRFSLLAKMSIALLGFGWNDITIAYVGEGNERYEGKTVAQIAREMGKSDIDAYLDLCEMSDFKGQGNMGPYSTPEIVREGYFADLTVFNEYKLKAGEEDQGHSFGIEKVFINGQLILDGDALNTEAMRTSGRAMRAVDP